MASRKDSKGRKLKDGETERKDGRYQYRYALGNGKRHTIYAKSLSELREKEKELQKDLYADRHQKSLEFLNKIKVIKSYKQIIGD